MADAALGAQPGVARHDLVHQFVGMQAALHQQAGLPAAHQLDRGGGRGVAVRRIDDGRPAQVQAAALGHVADLLLRTHQDGREQAQLHGLQRGAQRGFVAGWATAQGSAGRVRACAIRRS